MKMKRFTASIAALCICAVSAGIQASAASNDNWKEAYHNTVKNYDSAEWALYDIDSNGTPELFIAATEPGSGENYDINVFTYSNKIVKQIGEEYGASLYIKPKTNEIVFSYESLMARLHETIVYKFSGSTLTKVVNFAEEGNDEGGAPDFYINGKNVPTDSKEYNRYENLYNPNVLTEISFDRQEFWQTTDETLEAWKKAYIDSVKKESTSNEPDRRTNYSLIDFNQDGIPELVAANTNDDVMIYDTPEVYTYQNGKVITVEMDEPDNFGEKKGWWNIYSGSLYADEQSGFYYADYEGTEIYFKFNGTELILTDVFSIFNDNEYIHNGYDVSKSSFDTALKKYDSVKRNGRKVQYEYAIDDIQPILNYQSKNSSSQSSNSESTNNNQNNNNNNTNNNNTNTNTGKTGTSSAPKTGDAGTGLALAVLLTAAGSAVLVSAKQKRH